MLSKSYPRCTFLSSPRLRVLLIRQKPISELLSINRLTANEEKSHKWAHVWRLQEKWPQPPFYSAQLRLYKPYFINLELVPLSVTSSAHYLALLVAYERGWSLKMVSGYSCLPDFIVSNADAKCLKWILIKKDILETICV